MAIAVQVTKKALKINKTNKYISFHLKLDTAISHIRMYMLWGTKVHCSSTLEINIKLHTTCTSVGNLKVIPSVLWKPLQSKTNIFPDLIKLETNSNMPGVR